jgi:ribonuclease P/MRP protein subunit RPP40
MVYRWIEDWLKNRTQRVQFGDDCSDWIPVLSGVPQGSVLGPILFFIYINDTDDWIESKILKFADDTKLYSIITNEEDVTKLQEDLAMLCKWSREWLMLFI